MSSSDVSGDRALVPSLYAHELLANGGGIWLACASEAILRRAHDDGETGEEIRALFTSEQLDAAQRAAYAEGRKDEREDLEKRGVLTDCPACNGIGERPVFDSSVGPDAGDGGIQNCPDCDGTGYARPAASLPA